MCSRQEYLRNKQNTKTNESASMSEPIPLICIDGKDEIGLIVHAW